MALYKYISLQTEQADNNKQASIQTLNRTNNQLSKKKERKRKSISNPAKGRTPFSECSPTDYSSIASASHTYPCASFKTNWNKIYKRKICMAGTAHHKMYNLKLHVFY